MPLLTAPDLPDQMPHWPHHSAVPPPEDPGLCALLSLNKPDMIFHALIDPALLSDVADKADNLHISLCAAPPVVQYRYPARHEPPTSFAQLVNPARFPQPSTAFPATVCDVAPHLR